MSDSISLKILGKTLQEMREKRGLTLEQLSEKANVSLGFLSQVERGIGNPSFGTLLKISDGLGVPLASFFDGHGSKNQRVVTKDQRKRFTFPDRNLCYELLTPDLNRALEMIWVEYAPGVSTMEHSYSHQGEECGLVLEGKLEVHIGEESYLLEEGDSVSFRSILPHWYCNPGPGTAIAVWVITPPTF